MRPDKVIFDEPEKPEMVIQVPAKTQKLIHSIKPHKGHSLFEINPLVGTCILAEYESINAKLNGGVSKKVIAKDGHIYVSALNRGNALKRFFKMAKKQMEGIKK